VIASDTVTEGHIKPFNKEACEDKYEGDKAKILRQGK
jgi:hypothetical protein